MEIEYDSFGRMKYSPEFHGKTGTPWTEEDLQYLKDWYYKTSPEEMSFALERTIASIMQKVVVLKKRGEIYGDYDGKYSERIRK